MLKIQIMDMLLPWLLKTGGKLLITVLIAVIGYKVIRAIRKGVGRSMEKAGLEVTLRKFLDALLYAVLIGLLVFMVAEELGIKSSSLVTIAGAVTLAMSLSLQNTMANFAGGVLVLFLKPFKAGDYIVTKDGEGTVESIPVAGREDLLQYSTFTPLGTCLLYTSPSPRDRSLSRMPSSA